MNIPKGMHLLLQGKTDFLEEISQRMAEEDIAVATGPLPGTTWGTRAWLAVASGDVQRAMAVHLRHLDRMVEREGLPLRDGQADFDAEETSCPACLTPFRTAGATRCPECGLRFGGFG